MMGGGAKPITPTLRATSSALPSGPVALKVRVSSVHGEDRLLRGGRHRVGRHERKARRGAILGAGRVGLRRALADARQAEVHVGDLRQIGQAIVEFVVAQGGRVIGQQLHLLVDRQHVRALHRRHQRLVVRQGGALDGVAVVEQQGIGVLLAGVADQGGGAVDAVALVLGQLVIVVTQHVGVQVRGGQDGQVERGAPGHRRWRRVVVIVIAAATGGQAGQQQGAGRQCKDLSEGLLHRRSFRVGGTQNSGDGL
ncbi:hypothetical protein WJ971_17170 [Achromobacter xylosoxidans]